MSHHKHHRWIAASFSLLSLCAVTASARADVTHTGQWPRAADERVSLSFEGPRSKAIRELAKAAGWSIIDSPSDALLSGSDDNVNVYVTDQPAARVLDMLLSHGDYVVKREGKLLSISAPPSVGAPRAPAAEPTVPALAQDAQDRTVLGRHAAIAREEVVDNLTVLGGSSDLYGTVLGDVLVLGGSLRIASDAHVHGDVTVLGGSVDLADGARVDGDLSTAGGHIQRAAGAIVQGEETALASGKTSEEREAPEAQDSPWSFEALMGKLGGALSRTALLYAFGCVLLAVAGRHMQRMQHELSERPVRALAVGTASAVAAVIGLLSLCVTIIGIPVAILLVLVGALGVYAGMCAVFLELGALILEERTRSPYAHLAFGCLVYLIFSTLPFIGWLATTASVLYGLGLLISTQLSAVMGRTRLSTSTPT